MHIVKIKIIRQCVYLITSKILIIRWVTRRSIYINLNLGLTLIANTDMVTQFAIFLHIYTVLGTIGIYKRIIVYLFYFNMAH